MYKRQGIETGLDSNGRKNRGGHQMEDLVESYIKKSGVREYYKAVSYTHLDVYKRQGENSPLNVQQLSKILGKSAKKVGEILNKLTIVDYSIIIAVICAIVFAFIHITTDDSDALFKVILVLFKTCCHNVLLNQIFHLMSTTIFTSIRI